jgi:hypothetical protein
MIGGRRRGFPLTLKPHVCLLNFFDNVIGIETSRVPDIVIEVSMDETQVCRRRLWLDVVGIRTAPGILRCQRCIQDSGETERVATPSFLIYRLWS